MPLKNELSLTSNSFSISQENFDSHKVVSLSRLVNQGFLTIGSGAGTAYIRLATFEFEIIDRLLSNANFKS